MAKSKKIKIVPLYDNVLVRRIEEEAMKGGLYIPDAAKEKPAQGEVVSTGAGTPMEDSQVIFRPLIVTKGDKVLFGKYAGTEIQVNDEPLLILKENEILAIIKD